MIASDAHLFLHYLRYNVQWQWQKKFICKMSIEVKITLLFYLENEATNVDQLFLCKNDKLELLLHN